MARLAALVAVLLALPQDKAPKTNALAAARKKAVDELQRLQADMARRGAKGETADANCIIQKLGAFERPIRAAGAATPYPGDAAYEEILTAWGEAGPRIAALFVTAYDASPAGARPQQETEQAEVLRDWFATFPDLAASVRHLNRRRKFCKMPPVTLSWASSFGGFMHGRYLKLNRDHPSTKGLGAHNEDTKLPGYSTEGADMAAGIGGGGSPQSVMDGWLGSAYHRDPVFSRSVGRIALGTGVGWWCCKSAGGAAGKTDAQIFTWPGDGDTDIPTFFAGEAPNPLPQGMEFAGTFVVVDCVGRVPQKPTVRLLEEGAVEVDILVLGKTNPITFVARKELRPSKRYTVDVVGMNGFKHTFSFTTAQQNPFRK